MIQVVYSTQHWIVPHIVMGILVVLLAAIILTEGMARVKNGEPFFKKPGKFFIDNCDYVKLFGVIHCIYCMPECDRFYRIQHYLRVPV